MKKNEEKMEKLQMFDLSYFLGKLYFCDDGFGNMFVNEATFNMLELKEDKGTEYLSIF